MTTRSRREEPSRQLSLFSLPSPISVAAPPVPGAAEERAPANGARAEIAAPAPSSGDAPPLPLSPGDGSSSTSARTGLVGDLERPSPAPAPLPAPLPGPARPLCDLVAELTGESEPPAASAWELDAEQAVASHPDVDLGLEVRSQQDWRIFGELLRLLRLKGQRPSEARAPDTAAAETFFEAVAALGRPPAIGDPCPPWAFRGWLLWYVQLAHEYTYGAHNRWSYFLSCLEGRIPPGPIPQLLWESAGQAPKGTAQVAELIDVLARAGLSAGMRALERLVDWLSWGLGLTRDYPRMPDAVAEALYRSFNAYLWVLHPADYLGAIKAELTSNRFNSTAFFPTPSSVVEAMTRMCFTGGEDYRTQTVCDPCVGTGRFLLHASNYSLRLHGQDIDPMCVAITRINGAIYAPWMAWTIPGLDRPTAAADVGGAVETQP